MASPSTTPGFTDRRQLDWMISIDDHVLEHPRVWRDRLPARYRDVWMIDDRHQRWAAQGEFSIKAERGLAAPNIGTGIMGAGWPPGTRAAPPIVSPTQFPLTLWPPGEALADTQDTGMCGSEPEHASGRIRDDAGPTDRLEA